MLLRELGQRGARVFSREQAGSCAKGQLLAYRDCLRLDSLITGSSIVAPLANGCCVNRVATRTAPFPWSPPVTQPTWLPSTRSVRGSSNRRSGTRRSAYPGQDEQQTDCSSWNLPSDQAQANQLQRNKRWTR